MAENDQPEPESQSESESESESKSRRGLAGAVVRGVSLSALGYAIAQAITLATYIVLARIVSPHDFGVYTAATVLIGFTLLITESGMVSAVVQRRDRFEEAANTALLATLASGVTFSLLALATAPLLGLFFRSGEVTSVAAAMAGTVLIRIVSSVPDAVLQRELSFLRRLAIEPAQVVAFGVAAIVAAERGLGVWSLVIGQYAGTVVDVILTWILARWRPRISLASFAMWRELVAFGRHVFAATTILRIGQEADSLVVGRFLGTAPLGQFRYGYRLASAPFQMVLAAASYVLFPAFARIAHDRERHEAAFLRSLRWMSLIAMPAGLILLPLGEPLAVLVFGHVWRDAGYAAMAMCGYTAAGALTSVISEALKARGRPDRLVRMHTLSTVLTIALMLAFVPLGLTAVAAGISLGAIGAAVFALYVTNATLEISWRALLAEIWPGASAAIVMATAILGLELVVNAEGHGTALGLAILLGEGLAALAVFLAALRLTSPRTSSELWGAARAAASRLRPATARG